MLGGRGNMGMFMMWARLLLGRITAITGAVLGSRAEAGVVVVVMVAEAVVVMEEVGVLESLVFNLVCFYSSQASNKSCCS
jgi:hypothetical protein